MTHPTGNVMAAVLIFHLQNHTHTHSVTAYRCVAVEIKVGHRGVGSGLMLPGRGNYDPANLASFPGICTRGLSGKGGLKA